MSDFRQFRQLLFDYKRSSFHFDQNCLNHPEFLKPDLNMHNNLTIHFNVNIEMNMIKPASATGYKCKLAKSILLFTN